MAYSLPNAKTINYAEIPHFPLPTAIGHGRDLVYGQIDGRNILAFSGRIHYFEGYRSFFHNFFGYIASFLGCQLIVSTNSCGSMTPQLKTGDFMIISDHANFSHHPLVNGE
jgi:purine-nucleoside phosphorylase